MVEVRNNGVPLLEQFPKAGITQAVLTLANTLVDDGQTEDGEAVPKSAAAGANGWLGFLNRRPTK